GEHARGGNNSDVTRSWHCSDALSRVATSSVSKTTTSEGSEQSETGTCQDLAGNSASSTDGHVKLDKTKPTVSFSGQSPAANAKGWNKTDVTLSWTCADGLSGVVSSSDSHLLSSEGAHQDATGSCHDLAGNSRTDADGDVNLDKTTLPVTFAHQP